MEERRPRIGLEIIVRLQLKDSDTSYSAEILDISEGGFKIHIEDWKIFESFNEGDLLDFETHEEFFKIKGVGKIIWVSKNKNMVGVDFVEVYKYSKINQNELLGVFIEKDGKYTLSPK